MSKQVKSFEDMTVKQYQHCHDLLKGRTDTEFYIEVLSYLTGKTVEYYEKLEFSILHKEIDHAKFILEPKNSTIVYDSIIIGGRPYRGLTDITKGNFAQYSSIKTILSKGESTPRLHELLGCIYAPLKLFGSDYDMIEVAEKMKQAKISQVLGLVFFYSIVFQRLTPIINAYLTIAENSLQTQEKS